MHNKACHNMKNTQRTLIETLLDFNTVICGHPRSGQIGEATKVLASYLYDGSQTVQTLLSPNYLFNEPVFFLRNHVSRTAELFKNFVFLVFFLRSKKNTLE